MLHLQLKLNYWINLVRGYEEITATVVLTIGFVTLKVRVKDIGIIEASSTALTYSKNSRTNTREKNRTLMPVYYNIKL